MQIVIPERSSHWYTKGGQPFYEMPCLGNPGKMKSPTLADAKRMFLSGELVIVPSVTGITHSWGNPMLSAYAKEQGIRAAMKLLPDRQPEETDDDFIRRASEEGDRSRAEAADLGTSVHKAMERFRITNELEEYADPRMAPIMLGFKEWAEGHLGETIDAEKMFASKLGFGGRIDELAKGRENIRILLDYKTQGGPSGRKMRAYPNHGWQLAAYAEGMGLDESWYLWNVLISTTDAGRIEVRDWTKDRADCWQQFSAIFEAWCKVNHYDPRSNNNATD